MVPLIFIDYFKNMPLGLTVRTPPFHGGNVGFKSRRGHYIALWSNGRASDSDSENQGSIP